MRRLPILCLFAILSFCSGPLAPAQETFNFGSASDPSKTPVDVELVLSVDASGSIHPLEMEMQRLGYANALRSEEFLHIVRDREMPAIGGGTQLRQGRTVAIYYHEWNGFRGISNKLGWHLIEDEASALAFAAKIETGLFHEPEGGTSMAIGLSHAIGEIGRNAYEGRKKVIDVSADGKNADDQPGIEEMRDRAVAAGITVNGLAIEMAPGQDVHGDGDKDDLGPSETGVYEFMVECLIGGPGKFAMEVTRMEEFDEVIRRKMVQEIAFAPYLPEGFGFIGTAKAETPSGEVSCFKETKGSANPTRTLDSRVPYRNPKE